MKEDPRTCADCKHGRPGFKCAMVLKDDEPVPITVALDYRYCGPGRKLWEPSP